MIRTIKIRTRLWKIAAMVAIIPPFFFATACHDQVTEDAKTVAASSTVAADVPAEIQKTFDKMQAAKPDKKFILVETTSEEGKKMLQDLQGTKIDAMNIFKLSDRSFAILEMKMAQSTAGTDRVFTVVQETATPQGDTEDFIRHISRNLRYPKEIRENKTQGSVLVSFVVQEDGTLSDFQAMKSVDPMLTAEVIRVIQIGPKWNPGKQNGKAVKQRMILPVDFKLDGLEAINEEKAPDGSLSRVFIIGYGPQK